jgi:hypothetical protein
VMSMKALLTSTALLVTLAAGSVSAAGYVHWAGDTDDLSPGCTFTNTQDGTMTYAENTDPATGGTWSVSTAATTTVQVRHDGSGTSGAVVVDYISIVPANYDGNRHANGQNGTSPIWPGSGTVWSENANGTRRDEVAVVLDYTGGSTSSSVVAPGAWQTTIGNDSIVVADLGTGTNANSNGPTSGNITISVGGDADLIKPGGSSSVFSAPLMDANTKYWISHLITCVQGDGTVDFGTGDVGASGASTAGRQ